MFRSRKLRSVVCSVAPGQIAGSYDLCVLGAGQAGLAAATRGWDYGRRVAVVQDGAIGGATVNNGALSSKAMWQLSRQVRRLSEHDVNVDFTTIRDAVDETVQYKQDQFLQSFKGLQENKRYSVKEDGGGGSVSLFAGASAKFVNPNVVRLSITDDDAARHPFSATGGAKRSDDGFVYLQANNFVVATGSRPRESPAYPVDGEFILTSDHIGHLKEFPKSMLILGAGVIGCEFATIFGNFQKTKVHLVNERRDRLLPHEDVDMSNFIEKSLQQQGVSIHNGVMLKSLKVNRNEGCVDVELGVLDHRLPEPGRKDDINKIPFKEVRKIKVEKVLLSIGRVPNTDHLNLQGIGVNLRPDGGVEVSGSSLCSPQMPHIAAAGDVTVDVGLVSVAEMEGRYAVETLFGNKSPPTRLAYDSVSSIMFLRPEVACVGMNELEARRQGISHKVAYLNLDLINRVAIDRNLTSLSKNRFSNANESAGYIKMIARDDDEKQLLGIRAVGSDSSMVIEAVSLLMSQGASVRDLERAVHPHPAVTEGLLECARMLSGRSMNKPHAFPSSCQVSHYHRHHGFVKAQDRFDSMKRSLVPSYTGYEGGGTSRE